MIYIFIQKPEIWKPVTYPGINTTMYYVSTHGRVFSKYYNKILKPHKKLSRVLFDGSVREYYYVTLAKSDNTNNRKYVEVGIHRLVAWEFIRNLKPDQYNFVHHKNNDSLYNYYENLAWTNNKENQIEARDDGHLHPKKGDDHPNMVYNSYIIEDICKMIYIDKNNNMKIKEYIKNKYDYRKFNDVQLNALLRHLRKGDRHTDIVNKYKQGSTTIEKIS